MYDYSFDSPARWKNRVVNKPAGGVVTFGTTPAPVLLYSGPTGRKNVNGLATPIGAAALDSRESPEKSGVVTGREGDWLGNVNRGERI